MSRLQKKAQARTKQMVGQMIDHAQLVQEGKEEERHADDEDVNELRQSEAKRGD